LRALGPGLDGAAGGGGRRAESARAGGEV